MGLTERWQAWTGITALAAEVAELRAVNRELVRDVLRVTATQTEIAGQLTALIASAQQVWLVEGAPQTYPMNDEIEADLIEARDRMN